MKLYIVITEGVVDQLDSFLEIDKIFLRRKRAISRLKKLVENDKEINPDWYNSERYEQNWSEDSTYFEIYEKGYFEDNHFTVKVFEYNKKIKRM